MQAAFISPSPTLLVKRSERELGPRKDNSRLHNRDLQIQLGKGQQQLACLMLMGQTGHCFTFSAAVIMSLINSCHSRRDIWSLEKLYEAYEKEKN